MSNKVEGRFLRRYTELPFLIEFLQKKELTLLDPNNWDDKNDSYYLKQYCIKTTAKSIYSLCLSEARETYHHWKVFSQGSSGVRIEFHKGMFLVQVTKEKDLLTQPVTYSSLTELRANPPSLEELPFLKRSVFRDEQEFRLFLAKDTEQQPTYKIPVSLNTISRIILSPWLPKPVAEQTKRLLKSIKGCKNLDIFRSTLVDNENWKSFANIDI